MEKYKSWVLRASERFSDLMNIVLLGIIIVLSVGVVGLFLVDVFAFFEKGFGPGVGTILADLLVLWVLMELLHAQMEYLEGGRFNISVFLLVAMMAFIRKLMIASLKVEKVEVAYYPMAAILVLGVVYWLVRRTDMRKDSNN